MKILLTGAGSFIGRHLAVHLAGVGIQVIGTYRTESPAISELRNRTPRIELIRLNLADERDFGVLPGSIDAVVHVAGVSPMLGVTIDDMLSINVTGTRNVHLYALKSKAEKFIYASTLSVYGQITVAHVDEATPIVAPGSYGASKYLAERILCETSGELPAIAVRLPGVLGRGAHRAWIPTLAEKFIANETVAIYNPAAMFNNAAHVLDVSNLISHLIQEKSWRGFFAFPIGAGGSSTVGQVVRKLREQLGSISTVEIGGMTKHSFCINSTFAMQYFGYAPMHIEKMLNCYVNEISQRSNGEC
ncbi:MAG: NAD(P)-dependent oxidoreductase [Sterolibacteriaceae bacterium MAG5]|nr:NAD(P)-dependent oxidoreductase [Candidatus Nitricoxidireducens bremensis]